MIKTDSALLRLKQHDTWLTPYLSEVKMHLDRYNDKFEQLTDGKTLCDAVNGHLYFGFHRTENGWVFREWLPGADAVWLTGDFNGWEKYSLPLTNIGEGVWEIKLSGKDALKHGQHVKLIVGRKGISFERIPAYIKRTVMDKSTYKLCGQIWEPEKPFKWTDKSFYGKKRHASPVIYEAHIGMAQEKYGVGTYIEFADTTLEWIEKMGYNTVQLMAIQEHPYYASFGYQVTNFFAPSHHFGTPEELKYLINKAHKKGIAVLLDVVHSHACPNECEGLHMQDGTEGQYFHEGDRGWHPAWKTRIFNYGKNEVLHFLLSNLKYWQDEFHFDGFRFDGVTSMLYENHGLGEAFTNYGMYYSLNTNVDAANYLRLANELIHENNPYAVTVAEEMSGMPGMCLPLDDAGIGFDYRLSMGVPDMWIKLLKEQAMENWNMMYLWHELTTGRESEKTVGYAESHDQAMVGDKTIIFRLADAEMYTGMCKDYHTPSMDTAIDMHKLIRFITMTLSRDGYLNFMGNEFGHPEWIDFPREGNNWSYHYARRQWSLVESKEYKYEWLAAFDKDMIAFAKRTRLLSGKKPQSIWLDNDKNLIIFERGGKLFVFNLHPTQSQPDVFVSCHLTGKGDYKVSFSSDDESYGGQARISKDYIYTAKTTKYGTGFSIYLPCRCAVVLEKVKKKKES